MKKTIQLLAIALFLFGSVGVYAQQKQSTAKGSIFNKTTGSIKKSELISANKINLDIPSKKVISFMLVIGTTEYNSNSNELTAEMKTAINAINKPTKIMFTKIVAKDLNNQNAANERVVDLKFSLEP